MITQCTLHLQDECPRAGSGFRNFIVLKISRKWVSLHYYGTLTNVRISLDDYNRTLVEEKPMTWRVKAIINRTAKAYRKHRLSYNKSTIKNILT